MASASRAGAFRRKELSKSFFLTVFIILGAIIMVTPFLWLIIASTYPSSEIFNVPPNMTPGGNFWANATKLFESDGFGVAIRNSLFVSVVSTIGGVLVCTLAGYAFAKFTFAGRNAMFMVVILSLALPSQVTLVPLFQMMVTFGWLDSYQALILPALAVPFGIFLMRQAMQSVPDELIQAGRIDGAGEFAIFFRVVLPTVRPSLAAAAIFLFLGTWNDFVYPLVVLRTPDSYTVPVALAAMKGVASTDYGALMTGTLLSATPVLILFLFLQRYFVAGMLSGSVKE